jgi:hypothetical protein
MFDWRDILERAAWTMIQSFLAALPPGFVLTDLSAWKMAAFAGITAGVAFLISVLKNMAKQRLEARR